MSTNGPEEKKEASANTHSGSGMSAVEAEILRTQMHYAWSWFQYHADQRLKAFNYFILLLGALLVAYGTAMKEHDASAKVDSKTGERRESTEAAANSLTLSLTLRGPEVPKSHATGVKTSSYSFFAGWVAICAVVMSVAFFCIEVRNAELVECRRNWLDKLGKKMDMDLRKDDRDRVHLGKALAIRNIRNTKDNSDSLANQNADQANVKGQDRRRQWWDDVFTHKSWIRIIYLLSAVGFGFAAKWSFFGFK